MVDSIEALAALEKHKTMSKAATSLRLTQSAVSKRIAALEQKTETQIVVRQGRNVVLTPEAVRILNQARPLIAELKRVFWHDKVNVENRLVLGFSESILSSWGAKVIGGLEDSQKNLVVLPHAHRSPVVIDRVRSGEYMLGLCAGRCLRASDLEFEEMGQENFAILRSKSKTDRWVSIEEHSETWSSISRQVKIAKIEINLRMESFFSVAQLANSTNANALVPVGVLKTLRINKSRVELTKIRRPIILVGRKTMLLRKSLQGILGELKRSVTWELKKVNAYYG